MHTLSQMHARQREQEKTSLEGKSSITQPYSSYNTQGTWNEEYSKKEGRHALTWT